MGSFAIGMGGSVKFGTPPAEPTTAICVESWTMELRNDVQDVTTTCSGGFIDRIDGCTDATLTFVGFYDTAAPILTPIQPGRLIAFEADINTSGDTITADFIVQSVTIENPAKTTTKFTVVALSDGSVNFTPHV